MRLLAVLSLAIWGYLVGAHGRFWQAGPTAPRRPGGGGPPVAVVVPARDEAEHVGETLRSLLAQDYSGPVRVFLVDDGSTDGTGAIARAIADPRLVVIDAAPPGPGWSGKLSALAHGLQAAAGWTRDGYVLLTDADIVHDPSHLSSLVAHAVADDRAMVSEMAELRCESAAERALVPAFVFFFQLLYPFARAADPGSRLAAAAGGVVLLRRDVLDRVGGIGAIRGALIDDVALARLVKKSGARIWLGHATGARSRRPYRGPADVWRMVARTAYVQLRFSPTLLAATTGGMALVWLVPPLAAIRGRCASTRAMGTAAFALATGSYVPTLLRFGLNPARALLLPFVALFYMAATIGSALDHHNGRGVRWKSRDYGKENRA
jgi:hopene-associated glycosyltransferase HpnB